MNNKESVMNEEQKELAAVLASDVVRVALTKTDGKIEIDELKKMAENAVEAFAAGVKKINAAG